jgi:hypothetical protein
MDSVQVGIAAAPTRVTSTDTAILTTEKGSRHTTGSAIGRFYLAIRLHSGFFPDIGL